MKTFREFLLEAKINEDTMTPDEIKNFIDDHKIRKDIGTGVFKYTKVEESVSLDEEKISDIRTLKKGQKFKFKNSKDNNTYIITRKFNSNSLSYDNVNTKEHYIWDWSQVHERDVIVESK